eukprot:SAG11_NODE_251_length_11596_cov_5.592763_7_plen_480_part_00
MQAVCAYCVRKPRRTLTEIRLTNYDSPTVDVFQAQFANMERFLTAASHSESPSGVALESQLSNAVTIDVKLHDVLKDLRNQAVQAGATEAQLNAAQVFKSASAYHHLLEQLESHTDLLRATNKELRQWVQAAGGTAEQIELVLSTENVKCEYADLLILLRVKNFEPRCEDKEPSKNTQGGDSKAQQTQVWTTLQSLPMPELRQLAREVGATPKQLGDVQDFEDVRGETIKLLIRLLQSVPMPQLRQQAKEAGATLKQLGDVQDFEDVRGETIKLLVQLRAENALSLGGAGESSSNSEGQIKGGSKGGGEGKGNGGNARGSFSARDSGRGDTGRGSKGRGKSACDNRRGNRGRGSKGRGSKGRGSKGRGISERGSGRGNSGRDNSGRDNSGRGSKQGGSTRGSERGNKGNGKDVGGKGRRGVNTGGAYSSPLQLKTPEQRQLDREAQGLPILAKQHDFIAQLKRDKVTIVIAATGTSAQT